MRALWSTRWAGSSRAASNGSSGRASRWGRSAAKCSPTVLVGWAVRAGGGALAAGAGARADAAGVIGHVGGLQVLVELTDRDDHGDGDQVPAAEAAALTLHPTLLVGALQAGLAEERVEPVVAAQGDEPLVLDARAGPPGTRRPR